jgi:MraZ protein
MDEVLLSGTFEHTLDPKGRVTLPARYRQYFQNGVVLVRFPRGEPCISVFHPQTWMKYDARNIEPLDTFNDADAAWRAREIYMNQDEVEPDGQGRVLLGRQIADKLGLSGKVIIIGARTHLEIWDPDTFAERLQQMERRDA